MEAWCGAEPRKLLPPPPFPPQVTGPMLSNTRGTLIPNEANPPCTRKCCLLGAQGVNAWWVWGQCFQRFLSFAAPPPYTPTAFSTQESLFHIPSRTISSSQPQKKSALWPHRQINNHVVILLTNWLSNKETHLCNFQKPTTRQTSNTTPENIRDATKWH